MTVPVLQVEGLTVALPRGGDRREAVSGVSFEIPQGQLVCLVGESGSGKSIIAHTVMGLTPRNIRATAGEVRVNGEALLHAAPRRLRQLRGDTMSMIFQEPMTALESRDDLRQPDRRAAGPAHAQCPPASAGRAFWRFSATFGWPTRSGSTAVIRTSCPAGNASGS